MADPLDALLLQVQGSGRLLVAEPDGRQRLVRVAFAGHNGEPYKSVGRWLVEQGELTLEQRYQKIEGNLSLGTIQGGLRDARLRGFNIAFSYVDNKGVRRDLAGRVSGGRMEGGFRADNGTEGRWNATKK